MKNKKLYIISALLFLIPFAISIILYNDLPNQIPIHWNTAGEIDNYAPKLIALFVLPAGLMLVHIFLIWSMDKDPKHKNIPSIMYNLIYFLIPALSIMINILTINASLNTGIDINISSITTLLVGVIVIIIGNYLPKCKQSYTVGIKTPWTLDDEVIWNKTHRFAGFLWIVGGVLLIVGGFFAKSIANWYFLVIILTMVAIPYIYSYLLYKNKQS